MGAARRSALAAKRERQMKTLVNKNNPAIRITAEVETLYDKSRCVKYYYIKDLRLGLLQENWILVEEIKGNLEEIPSNVSIEEEPEKLHIDKPRGYKLASEDATANGFNQLKEPEKLSFVERLRERLSKMSWNEIDELIEEIERK